MNEARESAYLRIFVQLLPEGKLKAHDQVPRL